MQGTSIALYGTIGTNQPTVHYLLDESTSFDYKNGTAATQYQALLFLSSGLAPNVSHTFSLNVLDSGTFNLDFFAICTGSLDCANLGNNGTGLSPNPLQSGPSSTSSPSLTSSTSTVPSSSSSPSYTHIAMATSAGNNNNLIAVMGPAFGGVACFIAVIALLASLFAWRRRLRQTPDAEKGVETQKPHTSKSEG